MSLPENSVFVSYRIRDSSYAVDRLDERLKQAFGEQAVFRDVRGIPKGLPFSTEIENALQSASVGLVVIGVLWLEKDANSGKRRIDDADDWVRREVETLLGRQTDAGQPIPVIPVLLGGEKPPAAEDLPESIRELSSRNGQKLGPYPDFEESVGQLIDHIADILDVKPQPFGPESRAGSQSSPRIAATRLNVTGKKFVGREQELHLLDEAWGRTSSERGKINIVSLIGQGGEGKTGLVLNWYTQQAKRQWPNVRRVFDWSFYSQGSSDQTSASADEFFNAAFRWFDPGREVPIDAWQKGGELATLIARERTLLILDGLEPLQQPPVGGFGGEFKDPAMTALLRGLAANNPALCVLTSRVGVADLASFEHDEGPCIRHQLDSLDALAARGLLRQLGVEGPDSELDQAAAWFHRHAYDLNLLGNYLSKCTDAPDIRGWEQRFPMLREDDRIHPIADESGRRLGHGRRMLRTYKRWLGEDSPALAVLRLLGLFDRPAQRELLDVLRAEPVIPGLTDSLVGLPDDDWQRALTDLTDLSLISREATAIDSHPLLREHFGADLRETPDAWRAAHRRLYEHLCETTEEGDQPTLEDLQPLYQAVVHGCHAGYYEQTCNDVYFGRILRGTGKGGLYSMRKLGAIGSDLGAIACFFDVPWTHVSRDLSDSNGAWLLNQAGYRLRALGRLTEALAPVKKAAVMFFEREDWLPASIVRGNLGELELVQGSVAHAVTTATQATEFADRCGDVYQKLNQRAKLAHAHHSAGGLEEARSLFDAAESLQTQHFPFPQLYSVRGFRYCELLLSEPARTAWMLTLSFSASRTQLEVAIRYCHAVYRRARCVLKWRKSPTWNHNAESLLDVALVQLIVGRALLCKSILESFLAGGGFEVRPSVVVRINDAVKGIAHAGTRQFVPRAVLTRAWQRSLLGQQTGPESAESDLDEAWEIAARGPMPLFLADIHLHRARLFGIPRRAARPSVDRLAPRDSPTPSDYPWESVEHDLSEARRLIEKHEYGRRTEELEDAELALLGEVRGG